MKTQAIRTTPPDAGPYSKVYWPDEATKRQVQADAVQLKKSESAYIVLCVLAARNPVLFAELAAYHGTQTHFAGPNPGEGVRTRELEAELRHAEERREAAEARATELQARLEAVEAEKAVLLRRVLAEADLRESPIQGLVRGELAGPVETPPTEAVLALDALTGKPGASSWASESAIIAHMKEKQGVPDAATALSILRKAKRLGLAEDKRGQWGLTATGRQMAGA